MPGFSLRSEDKSAISLFKNTIEAIKTILTPTGIKLKPYHSESLPHFKALAMEEQKRSLSEALSNLAILEEAQSKSWSLKDDKRLLWAALKALNYTPTSDIFELLPPDSVLEVYNFNGIQIWRNLKCMEICSYTLEEMFCYSWQERYHRDLEASKEVIYFVERVLNAKEKKTVLCPVMNVVTEKFSEECYVLDTRHEVISPIFKGKVPMGFIVASKVKIIGNNKPQGKQSFPDSPGPSLNLI